MLNFCVLLYDFPNLTVYIKVKSLLIDLKSSRSEPEEEKYLVNDGKPASILFHIQKRPHTSVKTIFLQTSFSLIFLPQAFLG